MDESRADFNTTDEVPEPLRLVILRFLDEGMSINQIWKIIRRTTNPRSRHGRAIKNYLDALDSRSSPGSN